MHVLTFFEGHLDNFSVHTAANRDRIKGSYGPEAVEVNGKIIGLRRRDDDGHDKIAHAS